MQYMNKKFGSKGKKMMWNYMPHGLSHNQVQLAATLGENHINQIPDIFRILYKFNALCYSIHGYIDIVCSEEEVLLGTLFRKWNTDLKLTPQTLQSMACERDELTSKKRWIDDWYNIKFATKERIAHLEFNETSKMRAMFWLIFLVQFINPSLPTMNILESMWGLACLLKW